MVADKTKILRLLKTARGQLDGILKMVEEDHESGHVGTSFSLQLTRKQGAQP